MDRLKQIKENPAKYTWADTYVGLFYVLVKVAPLEAKNVLQIFSSGSPVYVQKIALAFLRQIENPKEGQWLSGDAHRDKQLIWGN